MIRIAQYIYIRLNSHNNEKKREREIFFENFTVHNLS